MASTTKKDLPFIKRQRDTIFARLQQIEKIVKSLSEESLVEGDLHTLQTYVELLTKNYAEILDIQIKIEVLENAEENLYEEERKDIDAIYLNSISAARGFIAYLNNKIALRNVSSDRSSSVSPQLTTQMNLQVQLPKIEVPKFSGSTDEWLDFRDIFQSLIHNNGNLNDLQKFHYLRASLQGDALRIIQSKNLSVENYQDVWDLLCKRYNNKRVLVFNHLKGIFDFDPIVKENARRLFELVDVINKHVAALNALEEKTEQWSSILTYVIMEKLDSKTAREWEECQEDDKVPDVATLLEFIKRKANTLDTVSKKFNKHNDASNISKQKPDANKRFTHTRSFVVAKTNCGVCNNEHYTSQCPSLMSLSINERVAAIQKAHLCINCLRKGHYAKNCNASRCRQCGEKHNTILHKSDKADDRIEAEAKVNNHAHLGSSTVMNQKSRNTSGNVESQVLLCTAIVNVANKSKSFIRARVLLDSGSQCNFVTLDFAKKLGIKLQKSKVKISGINGCINTASEACDLSIVSRNTDFNISVTCLVIEKITEYNCNKIEGSRLKLPTGIELADPDFDNINQIDILLGAEHFVKLLAVGQISLGESLPGLINTKFGWVIAGAFHAHCEPTVAHCNLLTQSKLSENIEKFWEIENVNETRNSLNESERWCEENYASTTKRDKNGNFIVAVPFTNEPIELAGSYGNALKRFYSLERKLSRDAELRLKYSSFINEYKRLGHMSEVAPNTDKGFFLPHHAVYNPTSLTTKLRVVFDGSARAGGGKSINDFQLAGPTLQDDLLSILLRFRAYTYVVSGDIEKMFRQILVKPEHRVYQKILWRDNPKLPLKHYELNTVTYGTRSATYLAVRTLHQIANNSSNKAVKEIVIRDFYVDDLLTGSDNKAELLNNLAAVDTELRAGGFKLRKWRSNCQEIVNALGGCELETDYVIQDETEAKTLGLIWNHRDDTFSYHIPEQNEISRVTKRVILSKISQVFDPLGLIGPVIIRAKIILQKLWLEKLDWDDQVSSNLTKAWLNLYVSLPLLKELKISRHVLSEKYKYVELHGFSDASESAYGACIYLRTEDESGNVMVSLLIAKTRVAPLNCVSIPRLELCASKLLTKLYLKVKEIFPRNFDRVIFWSDSMIVLGWLKQIPRHLKTFVGNRVSFIVENAKEVIWRHVKSKDNPADFLSRGLEANELLTNMQWWHGPNWLVQKMSMWPSQRPIECENLPEKRKIVMQVSNVTINPIEIKNYSSWWRLQRVTAYVFRFINRCKAKGIENAPDNLTIGELKAATIFLIKTAQEGNFANEILLLKQQKPILSSSKLKSLAPFLDENQLLRVGGRLSNSHLSYDAKYPILLPKDDHLTELIVRHEHIRLLHIGPQGLLHSLREKYWPLGGKSIAKRVVHRCMKCFKNSAKGKDQIMGDLPASRVTQGYPFECVGVDYAGPFSLKTMLSRGAKVYKAYVAIFICFKTKAMHLEVVTALSTEAFIATLKRFVARRGLPKQIWSDNATNFRGANKELQNFVKQNGKDLNEFNVQQGIQWNFIPARSPHFGGLWESGVKSVKHHLKRVLDGQNYTYEDFYTILVQIEAILNSRPLTPMSNDPNDFEPLSPAHFLHGKRLTSIPEPDLAEILDSKLARYEVLKAQVQRFWKRWTKEYLNQLQQKNKWTTERLNDAAVGRLVLLNDPNAAPINWQLARITAVHPGKDEKIRVVTVKTQHGETTRAVRNVSLLPIYDSTPNDEKRTSLQC